MYYHRTYMCITIAHISVNHTCRLRPPRLLWQLDGVLAKVKRLVVAELQGGSSALRVERM